MCLSWSDLMVGMCAVFCPRFAGKAVSGPPRSACRPLTANAVPVLMCPCELSGAWLVSCVRRVTQGTACPSFVPRGEDELWLAVELLGPRTCTLPSCFHCQMEQRSGSPSTGSPFPDVKLHLSWAHRACASASSPDA